jgi:hypothetical protein
MRRDSLLRRRTTRLMMRYLGGGMLSGTRCFEEEIGVKDAGVDVLVSSTSSFVEAVWFLWCIVLGTCLAILLEWSFGFL